MGWLGCCGSGPWESRGTSHTEHTLQWQGKQMALQHTPDQCQLCPQACALQSKKGNSPCAGSIATPACILGAASSRHICAVLLPKRCAELFYEGEMKPGSAEPRKACMMPHTLRRCTATTPSTKYINTHTDMHTAEE